MFWILPSGSELVSSVCLRRFSANKPLEILMARNKGIEPEEMCDRIVAFDKHLCDHTFLSELGPVLPTPQQVRSSTWLLYLTDPILGLATKAAERRDASGTTAHSSGGSTDDSPDQDSASRGPTQGNALHDQFRGNLHTAGERKFKV